MIYIPDHFYHIYNRGVRKQKIFFEPENYVHLTGLINDYQSTYEVIIAAYCFMPNHYHFILRQREGGSIGPFLRTVFNSYTQAINKRYGLSGTLFQGSAKSKHVETDSYCLQVIRYIHLNPVEAKLVKRGEEWQFSDYQEWIGTREGKTTNLDLRNGFFKNGGEYQKFVEEYRILEPDKEIKKYFFDE